MFNTRKTYEMKFEAGQYGVINAVLETMGLKVKQVRGNKFRGSLVGICRIDFKATEEELKALTVKLNKYNMKEA